jgi:hypothetical protein
MTKPIAGEILKPMPENPAHTPRMNSAFASFGNLESPFLELTRPPPAIVPSSNREEPDVLHCVLERQ